MCSRRRCRHLAAPRRSALEVAMLRRRRLGRPCGSLVPWPSLCAMCCSYWPRNEPVLVAVDDVQWLDASSSAALAFALRRLPASHVLLLLARRMADESQSSAARGRTSTGTGPARAGGAAQRGCAAPAAARSARHQLRAPDSAPGPGAVGWEPVLRVGAWPGVGHGPQPAGPVPGPEDPRTAAGRQDRRASRLRPSRRLGFVAALGTLPESLLERSGIGVGVIQPAVAAHVIERIDGDDPVRPSTLGVGRVSRPR